MREAIEHAQQFPQAYSHHSSQQPSGRSSSVSTAPHSLSNQILTHATCFPHVSCAQLSQPRFPSPRHDFGSQPGFPMQMQHTLPMMPMQMPMQMMPMQMQMPMQYGTMTNAQWQQVSDLGDVRFGQAPSTPQQRTPMANTSAVIPSCDEWRAASAAAPAARNSAENQGFDAPMVATAEAQETSGEPTEPMSTFRLSDPDNKFDFTIDDITAAIDVSLREGGIFEENLSKLIAISSRSSRGPFIVTLPDRLYKGLGEVVEIFDTNKIDNGGAFLVQATDKCGRLLKDENDPAEQARSVARARAAWEKRQSEREKNKFVLHFVVPRELNGWPDKSFEVEASRLAHFIKQQPGFTNADIQTHRVRSKIARVPTGRMAAFIRIVDAAPATVDWSPLKFVSFPDVTPWEGQMDKKTREFLGTNGCCFRRSCTHSICTAREEAMRHPLLRRKAIHVNFAAERAEERKRKREANIAEAEAAKEEMLAKAREAASARYCVFWQQGKCAMIGPNGKARVCKKKHGTAEETAAIKCFSISESGKKGGWLCDQSLCPYSHTPETDEERAARMQTEMGD